ncbi:hypothetical protein [Ectobacillus funiculus]|nr:hypothetical protein [Ectobacillus funiculus]
MNRLVNLMIERSHYDLLLIFDVLSEEVYLLRRIRAFPYASIDFT